MAGEGSGTASNTGVAAGKGGALSATASSIGESVAVGGVKRGGRLLLRGEATARLGQLSMEYDPQPPFGRVQPGAEDD